jgi:hypothetical protein
VGEGGKEHVFGRKGEPAPYQQCDGSCENITVIVTICADGTSITPAVIYKGTGHLVKWNQENPSNPSYVNF